MLNISQTNVTKPCSDICRQWRIQDFPQGGAPTPKIALIFHIFAENCMKMKEFGPPGGARVPGAPLGSANGRSQGYSTLADPNVGVGGAKDEQFPLGPISFIFMHFSGKSGQITGFHLDLRSCCPLPCKILDPPLQRCAKRYGCTVCKYCTSFKRKLFARVSVMADMYYLFICVVEYCS